MVDPPIFTYSPNPAEFDFVVKTYPGERDTANDERKAYLVEMTTPNMKRLSHTG
jgi:hypothetical protein